MYGSDPIAFPSRWLGALGAAAVDVRALRHHPSRDDPRLLVAAARRSPVLVLRLRVRPRESGGRKRQCEVFSLAGVFGFGRDAGARAAPTNPLVISDRCILITGPPRTSASAHVRHLRISIAEAGKVSPAQVVNEGHHDIGLVRWRGMGLRRRGSHEQAGSQPAHERRSPLVKWVHCGVSFGCRALRSATSVCRPTTHTSYLGGTKMSWFGATILSGRSRRGRPASGRPHLPDFVATVGMAERTAEQRPVAEPPCIWLRADCRQPRSRSPPTKALCEPLSCLALPKAVLFWNVLAGFREFNRRPGISGQGFVLRVQSPVRYADEPLAATAVRNQI